MKFSWLAVAIGLGAFSAAPSHFQRRKSEARIHRRRRPQPLILTRVSPRRATCRMHRSKLPPLCQPRRIARSSTTAAKVLLMRSAIGTSGCGRGVGNWYSVEGQVASGRQYAQQIESQIKLINDPVVTEYVNRVGQNLVRNLMLRFHSRLK